MKVTFSGGHASQVLDFFKCYSLTDLSSNFHFSIGRLCRLPHTNSFFYPLTRALQAEIFTVKFSDLMSAPITCSVLHHKYFIINISLTISLMFTRAHASCSDSFLEIHTPSYANSGISH